MSDKKLFTVKLRSTVNKEVLTTVEVYAEDAEAAKVIAVNGPGGKILGSKVTTEEAAPTVLFIQEVGQADA